ncbi:MAG: 50S ribosomal protein L9 [Xanthomonadales bacterium]|nr:50S ribosomal protein L9 [Xanthomonadales bacterium]
MEVILLEKVQKLGNLGDKVRVRAGYGRNFLLPQGKAVPATEANLAEFEARREELERAANERLAAAQARRDALADVVADFPVNVSPEGKLYGSIGAREISDKLTEMGNAVAKSEVLMGDGPLRQTGEFEVELQLHADIVTVLKVVIRPEE